MTNNNKSSIKNKNLLILCLFTCVAAIFATSIFYVRTQKVFLLVSIIISAVMFVVVFACLIYEIKLHKNLNKENINISHNKDEEL